MESRLFRRPPSSSGAENVLAVTDTNVERESRLRSEISSATDTVSSAALGDRFVIWNSAGGGSFPNTCGDKTYGQPPLDAHSLKHVSTDT